MQVLVRRGDVDLRVEHPAQPRADRGRVDVPHVGVADHGDVGAQVFRVRFQELRQVARPDLLLAFHQHGHAARRAAGGLVPEAQRLEPGHGLALVVHRAARDHARAVRAIDQHGFEGRAGPELERLGRLHVVVAVEQQMRRRRWSGRDGARPPRDAPPSRAPAPRSPCRRAARAPIRRRGGNRRRAAAGRTRSGCAAIRTSARGWPRAASRPAPARHSRRSFTPRLAAQHVLLDLARAGLRQFREHHLLRHLEAGQVFLREGDQLLGRRRQRRASVRRRRRAPRPISRRAAPPPRPPRRRGACRARPRPRSSEMFSPPEMMMSFERSFSWM